jgi:uncharacterized protein YdaU (DUF1376 family)
MNYYEHHIGDYAQATAHLTFVEDAAYSRLIRKYYAEEKPLPADLSTVQRLVGARTKEEKSAVDSVLKEFFFLEDDGWHNKRADLEILRYREKRSKAAASARVRWDKTQCESDANAMRTHTERNAHQSPDTIHQSPIKKHKDIELPVGVLESTWLDFVKHRKAKKAPITATAIKGIQREADKAGLTLDAALQIMCARGWTGFNAEWVASKADSNMTANQKSNLAFARAIFGDERKLQNEQRTIDITPMSTPAGFLGAEDF